MNMKKMVYTTKTGCSPLNLSDLGGGGFAVTSSFTYRYRAFRRCQTMAQAEGSVCLESSINEKAVFRQ